MSYKFIGVNLWNHFSVNLSFFSYPSIKTYFRVLKRTVSLRRFFSVPSTYFWLRNKKNNFRLPTLNWGLCSDCAITFHLTRPLVYKIILAFPRQVCYAKFLIFSDICFTYYITMSLALYHDMHFDTNEMSICLIQRV